MILVTGGTGLVGSHLLFLLASQGKRVRAIKRKKSNTENVEHIFEHYGDSDFSLFNRIDWVEGDVLDFYSLMDALDGVDAVYHCAATVSFHPSRHRQMWEVNVEGTKNILDASMKCGVKAFCHVSSIATLGSPVNGNPSSEEDYWQPDDKHSLYSYSKFMAEMEVWRASNEGFNALIVNPSVIIGAGPQSFSSSKIIRLAASGLPYYVEGTTGYVDAMDVADAMVKLTEKQCFGQRYILSAENLSARDVASRMALCLGARPPHKKAPGWLLNLFVSAVGVSSALTGREPALARESLRASQGTSNYSSEKVMAELGFRFKSIDASISNAVRYHKANNI